MTPGVGRVDGPTDPGAVVGPPGPNVVEDDVVAVHYETVRGAARRCTSDAEEHIEKNCWISGIIIFARMAGSDL